MLPSSAKFVRLVDVERSRLVHRVLWITAESGDEGSIVHAGLRDEPN
jgi:hypothetical protein